MVIFANIYFERQKYCLHFKIDNIRYRVLNENSLRFLCLPLQNLYFCNVHHNLCFQINRIRARLNQPRINDHPQTNRKQRSLTNEQTESWVGQICIGQLGMKEKENTRKKQKEELGGKREASVLSQGNSDCKEQAK